MKIAVELMETEAGHHFSKKNIRTISESVYEISDADAMEVRPDWAEYSPIVTFPAIERALNKLEAFPFISGLGWNRAYRFGIVKS